MKIGFDMDCVLAYDMVIQWSKKLLERYPHETLGRDWTQIKTYDLNQTYPLLSKEKLFEPVQEKGFFLNLTPEPYAFDVINNMMEEGHRIYIVSNICSVPHSAEEKILWLQKYFPQISTKDVVFTHHKSLLKLDALVDDWEENLKYGSYQGFLYNQPWNENISNSNLQKVNNLADFERKFQEWIKTK